MVRIESLPGTYVVLELIVHRIKGRGVQDHAQALSDSGTVHLVGEGRTLGKPGAIGLVKGKRTTLKNLKHYPDLQHFWKEFAKLAMPRAKGGRVDLLACAVAASDDGKLLVDRLEELTMQNEYQLRLKDLNFNEKLKEATEKFTQELDSDKKNYELLLQAKSDMD